MDIKSKHLVLQTNLKGTNQAELIFALASICWFAFTYCYSPRLADDWKIACLFISYQTTEFQYAYVKQSSINVWHVGNFSLVLLWLYHIDKFWTSKVSMQLLMVTKVYFGNLMAPDDLEIIWSWMPSTDQTVFI